jgi:tellurite resistance protein TehA-like permease
VLGPLGQSVTAAEHIGGVADLALPAPYADALKAFGVVYGVPVWGFALLWAGLAATMTVRAARVGLPFSLTWWSFTFPVGTFVTASSALARHTGADLFRLSAVGCYAALVLTWLIVASLTIRGWWSGRLFPAIDRQPIKAIASEGVQDVLHPLLGVSEQHLRVVPIK